MKLLLTFILLFSLSAYADSNDVYERVMKSGKIRCAYASWPPLFYVDVNKNQLGGVAYELTEAIGDKLDLEIEWVEEVNWGNIIEGLNTKRYDMFCTGLGVNAPRSKQMEWANPFVYTALYAFVRADEETLQTNADLNKEEVKISVLEGEAGALAARNNFPDASFVTVPQLAELPQTFQDVILGKADATVVDLPSFTEFNNNNPGQLKRLDAQNPVSVLAIAQGIAQDNAKFQTMINAALSEVLYDGTFNRILNNHPTTRDVFLMVNKPYEVR